MNEFGSPPTYVGVYPRSRGFMIFVAIAMAAMAALLVFPDFARAQGVGPLALVPAGLAIIAAAAAVSGPHSRFTEGFAVYFTWLQITSLAIGAWVLYGSLEILVNGSDAGGHLPFGEILTPVSALMVTVAVATFAEVAIALVRLRRESERERLSNAVDAAI